MKTAAQEIEYFNKAREYLLSFEEVTEEMLDAQLNEWRVRKPTDVKGLYKAFLLHAQNRQGDLPPLAHNLKE